jgi:hypothetical protein
MYDHKINIVVALCSTEMHSKKDGKKRTNKNNSVGTTYVIIITSDRRTKTFCNNIISRNIK